MDDGGESTTYTPILRYEYEVSGRSYACDAITTGSWSGSEAEAEELIARVRAQPRVVVHYDPEHPQEAALVVGVSGGTYAKLAFAITWLCFTTGFVVIFVAGGFGTQPRDVVTLP